MLKIDEILNKFHEFPTLPTVYIALTEVIDNPRSTFHDAARVISKDQSSSSKLLRAANSSIYGIPQRVETVTEAISFLGFQEVKNLVIALSIIKIFGDMDNHEKKGLNPVDLWKHSIAVGVISRIIGREAGIKRLDNFFTAGILHDIGKLFFFKFFPEEYEEVINYAILNGITHKEAEKQLLGITHSVAGDLIAEKWKLPKNLKNAICFHSSGLIDGKYDDLVACVHIADIAAYMLELGFLGENNMVPKPNFIVWNNLNIPEKAFSKNLDLINLQFQESVNLLLKA